MDPPPAVLASLNQSNPPTRVFQGAGSKLPALLRAVRPHQWAKNLLLFVPLLTSHRLFDLGALLAVGLGFVAFCAMASAGYVLNDLLDVKADRAHPVKKDRPFASAALMPRDGLLAFVALSGFGLAVALAALPTKFVLMLGAYFIATVSYSAYLKSKLLLDVLLLAGLYTLRVLAGGAAVDVVVSQWLLSFSMCIFLSLAFAKRYSELLMLHEADRTEAAGRGYRVDDMELVLNVGATSGFLAVLVFTLYINSDQVRELYRNVDMLWFTCPIFLYWILRIWFLARRGELPGDPVTFALRDRHSLVAGLLVLATVGAAALL